MVLARFTALALLPLLADVLHDTLQENVNAQNR